MTRRARLPGAAELFRPTGGGTAAGESAEAPGPVPSGLGRHARARRASALDRPPSGRIRHDEKITVYCSADELVALESARLALRAEHALAVDRGRIVREALAVVLADLEAKGGESILVRRLRGDGGPG